MPQTYDEFIAAYNERTNDSKETGYQEAPYGYDSAWAVAMVLNRTLQHMRDNGKLDRNRCEVRA